MRSPDQLRAEAYRLLDEAKRSRDPTVKQTLAAQAFELAQQAEAIASFPNDPEGLRLKIAQHRHMLSGASSEPRQRMVAQLLRYAEDKLQRVSNQQRAPRPHRVAAA
jgi:hypothetical protein